MIYVFIGKARLGKLIYIMHVDLRVEKYEI